ncbi:MAG: hypothetical protein ABI231_01025 [Candidatus Tumulicola sp.]
MQKRRTRFSATAVDTAIGYAANGRGNGVVYARVTAPAGEHLLRMPFRVSSVSAARNREVGYAALTAVVRALHGWGVGRVRFALDDATLIDDLAAHRDVPAPIVLPYVRLCCALNQLGDYTLEFSAEGDLAARARAEVALNVAA